MFKTVSCSIALKHSPSTNVFSAECELLCVYKEDFDEILKDIMETRHEDIRSAVRRFEYFKNFTDEKVK